VLGMDGIHAPDCGGIDTRGATAGEFSILERSTIAEFEGHAEWE